MSQDRQPLLTGGTVIIDGESNEKEGPLKCFVGGGSSVFGLHSCTGLKVNLTSFVSDQEPVTKSPDT